MRNKAMKRKTASILALAVVAGSWSLPREARAEDKLTEWVRSAREAEARGQYADAGQQYYFLMNNEFNVPMSYGVKAALGRRAVACLTIAARKEMQSTPSSEGWFHAESLNTLEQAWRNMMKLEPNCPTWPYLLATRECAQGRYVEARTHLNMAIKTTSGQASVRKKAQQLLSHIAVYASKDHARLEASDKAAMEALLSGRFMTNVAGGNQTGSDGSGGWQPESISDSERRARNAEYAGDSGAAARFRSGGTTVQDHSKYW
ncbi:MAG: hypothetical protein AB7W16_04860 [Candidatus Obscuribacterales bacterium]